MLASCSDSFYKFFFRRQIVWPTGWKTNFTISVDGVHCRFHELEDDKLAKNPENYSHKFNGPGLAYELALSIFENKLVWMRGPFKPSKSDLGIYQGELKGMLPVDKRVVCDGGIATKMTLDWRRPIHTTIRSSFRSSHAAECGRRALTNASRGLVALGKIFGTA